MSNNKTFTIIISTILIILGIIFGINPQNNPVSGPTNTCPSDVSTGESKIKVGAFNIQIFGEQKASNDQIMDVLTKIAKEYDVILVQEIRDADGTVAPAYLEKINQAFGCPKFAFVQSARLGRSSSKEAYAYFYNQTKVTEINNYVYDDTNDKFEREPYIATFKSKNFDFTLVGIHTKPDAANQEIANLDTVVNNTLAANPNEKDIIVMGDFNADGSYFNENNNTNPFKAAKYSWVISNGMDTMVKTNWTYDRIVMTNATLSREYIPNSAKVFYYDQAYGITDNDFVADISDHYPVYAEFRTDLNDDD